jgi:hypothetical protein
MTTGPAARHQGVFSARRKNKAFCKALFCGVICLEID